MRADRILPWLFFFPIMTAYAVMPDPFDGDGFGGQIFVIGIASWVFFMIMTFWQGLMGLIKKDYFDRQKGYPALIAGMNLWMIVLCAHNISSYMVFVLPLGAHMFIFALHFFQTSLFTKQNRTL